MSWLSFAWKQVPAANVLIPLFSGVLGATLTALATSRREKKRDVTEELNCIAAAHLLSYSIANRFIGLKRQHVRPLKERYDEERRRHEQFDKTRALTKVPRVFELHANLQTITPLKLPTDVLERLVFEKISIRGRALMAAVDLTGAIDGLEKSINSRNETIDEIRTTKPSGRELLERYLGTRSESGAVDERMRTSIEAIHMQTDDCIFFAKILGDDLLAYGNKLRRQYRWRYRLSAPPLLPADWSIAEAANLIPPTQQYKDWLRGFERRPNRWQRLATRWPPFLRLRLGAKSSRNARSESR